MNYVQKYFPLEVIICLNGKDSLNESKKEIERFINFYNNIKITLLVTSESGKNNALNNILSRANQKNSIIHFLDDDVDLDNESIINNINALIRYRAEYNIPVLVGSNFYAKKRDFRYYKNKELNLIKAIKKYLLFKIFSLPFTNQSQKPSFCLGRSL